MVPSTNTTTWNTAMSRFLFFTSCFLFLALNSFSQIAPSRYVVRFTDKTGSPFSINSPEEFLSERALHRRAVQNIEITENDLPVNQNYIDSVVATGAQVLNRSKWFNSVTIRATDSTQIDAINALPFVVNVSSVAFSQIPTDNYRDKFQVETESMNKDLVASPALNDASYGMGLNQITMLNGVQLHEAGFRGQGMWIAVLDAGFSAADILQVFDSLRNENRIIATKDFVEGDDNVFGHSTHGTMVLSTMAGNMPGDLIGTAPKASYLLLRSEESASEYIIEEYNWASAAEFADSAGADVINSSLGYTDFNDALQNHTYADLDGNTTPVARAADIAASKGILVVNSAGNEGDSPWFHISSPADADSVLAVGAVDPFGDYVSFSGKGYSSDGRIKPNVVAQGRDAAIVSAATGAIITGNGTSFSGPIIAGMATCLWQANGSLTNMQVLHAIEQSAHQFSNPDSLMGYGIPNFAIANLILSNRLPTDLAKDELLTVYPSPFEGELTAVFYSALDQPTEVRLTAADGRELYLREEFFRRNTSNIMRLPLLENFAQGVYTFSVTTPGKVYYKKVLKK